MKEPLTLSSLLLAACAFIARGDPKASTPVAVRIHNNSDVDVYLLGGHNSPEWLGTVPKQGAAE